MIGTNSQSEAFDIFQEWCEERAYLKDEIEFVERQNDIATLRISTGEGKNTARDFLAKYCRADRTPLRVASVDAVGEGVIEVEVLLAEAYPSGGPRRG